MSASGRPGVVDCSSVFFQFVDVYVKKGWAQAASLSNSSALMKEVCVFFPNPNSAGVICVH